MVTLVGTIEGSGGVIYRYVGDQAIITWRLDETRDLSGAVEVVFRLRARIAARREEYRSRFGVTPEFRAAMHTGPVVAGEMGDSKLEIVLPGDTVNDRVESADTGVPPHATIHAERGRCTVLRSSADRDHSASR